MLGDEIHKEFPFVEGAGYTSPNLVNLLLNRTWRPALSITGAGVSIQEEREREREEREREREEEDRQRSREERDRERKRGIVVTRKRE